MSVFAACCCIPFVGVVALAAAVVSRVMFLDSAQYAKAVKLHETASYLARCSIGLGIIVFVMGFIEIGILLLFGRGYIYP